MRTCHVLYLLLLIPQRYDFSSKSQPEKGLIPANPVVVNTTKVRFFKQITTPSHLMLLRSSLLLIPQRYDFSSKSQRTNRFIRAYCVVVNTTKVRFFKQITTGIRLNSIGRRLLLIPQRYDFSSKSQLLNSYLSYCLCCC